MLRRRMMMAQGGVSLPAGYTKIEYLESDGNSYIDTGFKPNQDTRVICDYLVGTKPNTSRAVYGCTDGSKYYGVFLAASDFTNVWYNTAIKYDKSVAGRWLIDQNKNVATINGDTLTWSAATLQFEYSLFLFACNGPNVTYVGASRIYSFKIYDNGVLVRDLIPCTNPDGISGLWDSVNDVFYKMLPADYTKLDFIESNGTTYIDTGFKPNNNTRVVFKGYSNSSLSGWIFGSWASATSNQFAASCLATYSIRYGTKNAQPAAVTVGDVNIDMNKNKYTYNGASGSFDTQTFSSSYPIYLFAINDAGRVSSGKFYGKLYSCQIYDNGTLVRDFIPAMNASGEAGLYDLKNDVWYALLPVAKPKVENKISTWQTIHDETPEGYILFQESGLQSEYPVASDITVTAYVTTVTNVGIRPQTRQREFTILKGTNNTGAVLSGGYYEDISSSFRGFSPIISISPTEDDTYIYTF